MKCPLEALVSRVYPHLLAQEGTPLSRCIDNDDRQQCSHWSKKEHFHAPRIAQTRGSVLCSEFADAKQLWKVETEICHCEEGFSPTWQSPPKRMVLFPEPLPFNRRHWHRAGVACHRHATRLAM